MRVIYLLFAILIAIVLVWYGNGAVTRSADGKYHYNVLARFVSFMSTLGETLDFDTHVILPVRNLVDNLSNIFLYETENQSVGIGATLVEAMTTVWLIAVTPALIVLNILWNSLLFLLSGFICVTEFLFTAQTTTVNMPYWVVN